MVELQGPICAVVMVELQGPICGVVMVEPWRPICGVVMVWRKRDVQRNMEKIKGKEKGKREVKEGRGNEGKENEGKGKKMTKVQMRMKMKTNMKMKQNPTVQKNNTNIPPKTPPQPLHHNKSQQATSELSNKLTTTPPLQTLTPTSPKKLIGTAIPRGYPQHRLPRKFDGPAGHDCRRRWRSRNTAM
jgi:hypothetical protein